MPFKHELYNMSDTCLSVCNDVTVTHSKAIVTIFRLRCAIYGSYNCDVCLTHKVHIKVLCNFCRQTAYIDSKAIQLG